MVENWFLFPMSIYFVVSKLDAKTLLTMNLSLRAWLHVKVDFLHLQKWGPDAGQGVETL